MPAALVMPLVAALQFPAALAQSWVVQLGAAVALMMPGGALAWKVLRNGRGHRNGGPTGKEFAALQERVNGICEDVEGNKRGIGAVGERSENAVAGLRAEIQTWMRELKEDARAERRDTADSIRRLHEKIEALR